MTLEWVMMMMQTRDQSTKLGLANLEMSIQCTMLLDRLLATCGFRRYSWSKSMVSPSPVPKIRIRAH